MSLGKDRAAKITQKEAIAQSKRELQLRKAPLLKVRADVLWQSVIARLTTEVGDFNGSLSDHPERHLKLKADSDSIEIRKSNYSQERLTANLNLAEERIAVRRVTTPAPGKGQPFEMRDSLDLDLDDDKNLYVRRQSQILDLDAMVDFLLEHMME